MCSSCTFSDELMIHFIGSAISTYFTAGQGGGSSNLKIVQIQNHQKPSPKTWTIATPKSKTYIFFRQKKYATFQPRKYATFGPRKYATSTGFPVFCPTQHAQYLEALLPLRAHQDASALLLRPPARAPRRRRNAKPKLPPPRLHAILYRRPDWHPRRFCPEPLLHERAHGAGGGGCPGYHYRAIRKLVQARRGCTASPGEASYGAEGSDRVGHHSLSAVLRAWIPGSMSGTSGEYTK